MGKKKKSLVAVGIGLAALLAVAIMSVAIVFQMQVPPPNGTDVSDDVTTIANDSATEDVTPKENINVFSTKSAFPFVQRWAAQYNNDDRALASVQVSYMEENQAVAIGQGNNLAIVGDVYSNNATFIPLSAQAVAIVYNIPSFPDIPSGLKLNASLLSNILNGNITQWNDAAITDLNQGLNLPNEKIVVIHENTNSSSLRLVERYLGVDVKKPGAGIISLGPDEMATMVRKTPYSIGYVDFSYAIQTKMTFAAVGNPGGSYVVPSMDSISQAVATGLQVYNATGNGNQTVVSLPPSINAGMLGNSSYPLVGFYYAAVPDGGPASLAGNDTMQGPATNGTLDFVGWIISDGQQTLSEVQYPPIYTRDNGRLAAYVENITASYNSSRS